MTTELNAVDAARYRLADPGGATWRRVVHRARRDLTAQGCCVLPGFVRAIHLEALREECAAIADRAHVEVATVNVYNTEPDPDLPPGHPARRTVERGNAFVARDRIPTGHLIHRLYTSPAFQAFLADCLGVPRVHPLADPLAGLCLNVVAPGREHPWHFDTNEFAISMVTQGPESGGEFEYCPDIRSPGSENLAEVSRVLAGDGADLVRRLVLRPGDLQLFRGRYSLHRVTRVTGAVPRHSAIFSYSQRPGVVGRADRTRQLFGRVTPIHRTHDAVRVDELLD